MKLKKILLSFLFLLVYTNNYSQQIGNGYAPNAIPSFNIDLLSGFYQGNNATGQVQAGWAHLLNLRHNNVTNTHQLQITSSYSEDDKLYFRKFARGTLGINNPTWFEIATRGVNTFVGNQTINGFLNVTANNALNFSTHGGGFYMSDTSWIRTSGNKNFYHNTGIMRTDGIFHVGPSGDRLVVNSNGNVGIGTTTPSAKLEVNGGDVKISNYSPNLILQRNTDVGGFIQGIQTKLYDGTNNWFFGNLNSNSWIVSKGDYQNPKMTILENGNVGFGDANPLTKFVIRDAGQALYFIANHKLVGTFPGTPEATTMTITSSGNLAGNLALATGNTEIMRITTNGKVGIGTTNPDEKLTVKGKIHAEEIKVDLAVPADYVFQKYYTGKSELKSGYAMPTLAEIESFTKENHHLPNVPSAKEIQQNGLPLGEMSNVLLQKIEELTLYAIEQDKKAALQQQELERLKTENENYKSLAERLSAMEKELKK